MSRSGHASRREHVDNVVEVANAPRCSVRRRCPEAMVHDVTAAVGKVCAIVRRGRLAEAARHIQRERAVESCLLRWPGGTLHVIGPKEEGAEP